MELTPYQLAFNRIHAEFVEMPGMTLTAEQVGRLCGVELSICQGVLNDLVRAQFLVPNPDRSYRGTTHLSSIQTVRQQHLC
jgi:hypothetical protein